MKGNTKQHVKNVRRILKYIRDNQPIITNELRQKTRFSNSNVAAIISELSASEYIVGEAKGNDTVGRKAIAYSVHPDKNLIIGIDFNVTGLLFVITDLSGHTKQEYYCPLLPKVHSARILESLYQTIDSLLVTYHGQVIYIGISVQGSVDYEKGVSKYIDGFTGWKNIPLQELLEERYHIPTLLIHDTDCRMRAEQAIGVLKGKEVKNALLISIQKQGCGMSILANGQIYTGAHGYAGEIGRFPFPSDNKGTYTCLDTLLGKNKFPKMYYSDATQKQEYEQKFVQTLGYVLIAVANMFNPECIILHGDVLKYSTELEKQFYDWMKIYTYDESTRLEFSYQKEDVSAVGAALCASDHVIDSVLL